MLVTSQEAKTETKSADVNLNSPTNVKAEAYYSIHTSCCRSSCLIDQIYQQLWMLLQQTDSVNIQQRGA